MVTLAIEVAFQSLETTEEQRQQIMQHPALEPFAEIGNRMVEMIFIAPTTKRPLGFLLGFSSHGGKKILGSFQATNHWPEILRLSRLYERLPACLALTVNAGTLPMDKPKASTAPAAAEQEADKPKP